MKPVEGMRTVALGIGIGVLIPLTVYYGIQLIKPEPRYPSVGIKIPEHLKPDATEKERQTNEEQMRRYQEAQEKVMNEYQSQRRDYEAFYFYVTFGIGIILLILGSLVIQAGFLGAGCILGGILTLVTGYLQVWGHLSNLIKFISLLAGLLLLFILGTVVWKKK